MKHLFEIVLSGNKVSSEFILLSLSLFGFSLCLVFLFVYTFVMDASEPGSRASPPTNAAPVGVSGKPTTRSGVVFPGMSVDRLGTAGSGSRTTSLLFADSTWHYCRDLWSRQGGPISGHKPPPHTGHGRCWLADH